jgi:hypothetical protein
MRVAIHQPNFLPWIGYFHKISLVDKFVFLDDVQFERGKTYTQRTKILVNNEEKWITIPVINKSEMVLIKDIKVDPSFIWKRKILKTIEINYLNTSGFNDLYPIIEDVFKSNSFYLIDYNTPLIINISRYLDLTASFAFSSQLNHASVTAGNEKILAINEYFKAKTYISGTGAGSKRYIDPFEFERNGVCLAWQEFQSKKYAQFKSKSFVSGLSIIDLIFNCGKDAIHYL